MLNRLALLGPAFILLSSTPSFANGVEGTSWRTQAGTGIVRIEACGAKTCGRITRIMPAPGQTATTDLNNPNPALKSRPIVGLNILSGFIANPDGRYKGGTIYDPTVGKSYRSEFRLKPDGKLEVKGCIGPLCQTQLWTRSN